MSTLITIKGFEDCPPISIEKWSVIGRHEDDMICSVLFVDLDKEEKLWEI